MQSRSHGLAGGMPVKRLMMCMLAGLLAMPSLTMARETPLTAAEARAVRGVVESQLDAFARDDPVRAFSFAAPPIRRMFQTPERFMAMVRQAYPVVYRPASVTFLKPERIDGVTILVVRMTDSDGAPWLALYRMTREADKSWRIGGVELSRTGSRAI